MKIGFLLSELTGKERHASSTLVLSIHVQQSLSMLELLMAVPLNYEMLESRCINVPKSSIKRQAMLQAKSIEILFFSKRKLSKILIMNL